MLIETKDLSYTYMPGTPFEVEALKGVNIGIEQGEFIGIIGETGSGKTTLIQHFNGLLKPTAGEIFIDGQNIWDKDTDLRKLRAQIALLFQFPEHQLFEETVFKDVSFGPKNLGLENAELRKRVLEGLRLVGLDAEEYAERSPFSLSGGEKRRVAMAGILAMQPEAIILDEPTAGLDPAGRRSFLEQIKRLHREKKITIIMVTHNMEEASLLAGRLFVLSRGGLVLQGSPAEIFQSAETIKEIGLDLPPLTTLLQELKKSGKNIRTDIFTVEKAGKEILNLYRRCRR